MAGLCFGRETYQVAPGALSGAVSPPPASPRHLTLALPSLLCRVRTTKTGPDTCLGHASPASMGPCPCLLPGHDATSRSPCLSLDCLCSQGPVAAPNL